MTTCQKCNIKFTPKDPYHIYKFCSYKCFYATRKGCKFSEEHRRKLSEHLNKVRVGFKKGHIPWHKGKKNPKMAGSLHPFWKGDSISPKSLHPWIVRNWEKPISCQHCQKVKKLDWANIDGSYKRERTNFLALCRSCHFKYDYLHGMRKVPANAKNLAKIRWSKK